MTRNRRTNGITLHAYRTGWALPDQLWWMWPDPTVDGWWLEPHGESHSADAVHVRTLAEGVDLLRLAGHLPPKTTR